MNENDQQAQAIAKANRSQRFMSSRKTYDEEKPVSRYTFFILGLISFFAGSWAIICLVKASSSEGIISLVKQLTSALIGR